MPLHSLFQPRRELGHDHDHDQVDHRHLRVELERALVEAVALDRLVHQVRRADGGDDRRVLDDVSELVDEGGDGDPPRLRKRHRHERRYRAQAQAARRLPLARVDRLDCGAVDLGHVGAVEERQRHDPGGDRVEVDAEHRRDAEVDEQDVDVERQRSEDLHVEKTEHADGPWCHANERDDEAEDKRQRHRQQRDPDRHLQTLQQEGQDLDHNRPVERVRQQDVGGHATFSLRSRTYTTAEKKSTRTTRMMATAANTSKGVKSVTLRSLATKTMSGTAIREQIVAPLSSPTKVLPSGGTTIRNACGRMTWPYVRTRLSPIERAASICPRSMAARPARKIS